MAPLGILLIIPLLVGVAGFVIWWQGRDALDESVDAMAYRQFGDSAQRAAEHASELLGHAGPLTDNMVAYVRAVGLEPPLGDFAVRFRDQLRACPGVAYISFGTRDGNYFGAYVDPEGRYVVTHRSYGGPGKTHKKDYFIAADGALTLFEDDPTHGFDPRTRPWFIESVRNARRTWSAPYVWFDIGVVGITCSEPIFNDDGELLAVTTVDFHLNGLSAFVEGLSDGDDTRTFIFTDALELVAYPGARQEFGQGMEKGKKLEVSDLTEADTTGFFAARPPQDEPGRALFSFEADGAIYLAATRRIRLGEDQRWTVATIGPRAPLVAPARAYQRSALVVSGVALLIATLVAAFFARFIVKTHLRVTQAEVRAQAAEVKARRLGSYRMTHKLGEGGMGEVWIAEHDMLARPAAIKLIRPQFLESQNAVETRTAVERFRREARVIAGLRSRHTIHLYDFGVADDGSLFYVMELLDGIDLDVLVERFGPLPPRRVVEVLAQAAASLQEAHENGVVHRDIKPANIFLCREADEVDVVRVLDFGMAREADAEDAGLTMDGDISGTPAFMSPEQVRGGALDGRADLYALGCVGYWLLTGKPVFKADSAVATAIKHVTDDPTPVGEVAPVPEALAQLIMRCLAKDPDDRPADMAALIDALPAVFDALPEDGWSAEAKRRWWDAVPHREATGEAPPDGASAVQMRPKRTF